MIEKLIINPEQKVRMFISLENATAEQLEAQGIKVIKTGKYANYVVVEGNYSVLNKLIANPSVKYVYEDGVVKAIDIPVKPVKPVIQDEDWNVEAIKADIAHKNGITGQGAVIAVVDTGVNHNLSDLSGNYIGGYDFVYDDSEPDDVCSHGTKVASVAVAKGERKTGVAPEAKYLAVKVLNDQCWGNWSDVIAGLEWILEKVEQGEKIDVVSMSLGASIAPKELEIICNKLRDKGVILVAASGNENSPNSLYPAAYDGVISVGAVDINLNVARFSNGGADVAAPGVQVFVLSNDDNLYLADGTSIATPHVSAVLALVESRKDISPAEAFELLKTSTDEINDPENKVKYGQINAVKAVNNALNLTIPENPKNWFDYIYEPQIQIVIGLVILALGMKVIGSGRRD
ncbi:MAG: S8 family serine peptidase [Archaeoglobaceae archaeon]